MPVLERAALYRDGWSRPCTRIAADLGISGSALKRVCEAMDIPTPKAGHWTRVECGKKVTRMPLPKAKKDTRLTWDIDLENSRRQKEKLRRREKQQAKLVEAVARPEFPQVELAKDTENLHPLVKATRAQLREAWSKKAWDQRKERKRLDARVFEGSLDRALVFLDGFVRGVEALGMKFVCEQGQHGKGTPSGRNEDRYGYQRREEPSGICWVEAAGEAVSVTLREKRKRVMVQNEEERRRLWGRQWDEVPSGEFEFTLGAGWGFSGRSQWKDAKVVRLEEHLGMMIASVPMIGEFLHQQRLNREAEERRRKSFEELRWRMSQVQRQETEAIESLSAQAERSRQAELLKVYVERVRQRYLAEHGQPPEEASTEDLWFRWAAIRIEALDPVSGSWRPWRCRSFRSMTNLFPND